MESAISPVKPSADFRLRRCRSAARYRWRPPASGWQIPERSSPPRRGPPSQVDWKVCVKSGASRWLELEIEAPALADDDLLARMRFQGSSLPEVSEAGRPRHPPGSRLGQV